MMEQELWNAHSENFLISRWAAFIKRSSIYFYCCGPLPGSLFRYQKMKGLQFSYLLLRRSTFDKQFCFGLWLLYFHFNIEHQKHIKHRHVDSHIFFSCENAHTNLYLSWLWQDVHLFFRLNWRLLTYYSHFHFLRFNLARFNLLSTTLAVATYHMKNATIKKIPTSSPVEVATCSNSQCRP